MAAKLKSTGDVDLVWLANAIERYDHGAPLGRSLEEFLGLTARGGAGPWWKQEQRSRRDALLKTLYRDHFSDLHIDQAASEIIALASTRQRTAAPPSSRPEVLVDAALRTGLRVPGPRRLATVLGNPIAD